MSSGARQVSSRIRYTSPESKTNRTRSDSRALSVAALVCKQTMVAALNLDGIVRSLTEALIYAERFVNKAILRLVPNAKATLLLECVTLVMGSMT